MNSIRSSRSRPPGLYSLLLILLTVAVWCTGCSAVTSDEPPVSDSTLVQVLLELHLASARAEVVRDVSPTLRDSILFHYGLDSTSFEAALSYYIDRPEEYKALYTKVLDQINEERFSTIREP
jgi:hypothetical protein